MTQGSFITVCSGPEITDELVKVLRKRLDETTLDIITVMLVRNCKLTPADVEVHCYDFHFLGEHCFCVSVCVVFFCSSVCSDLYSEMSKLCPASGLYPLWGKQKALVCTQTTENCFR